MSEYMGGRSGGEASSVSYAMIEHAFDLWRNATAYLAQIAPQERRAAYENAIVLGIAFLQRYESMQALLEAYYAPHDTEPAAWIEHACRSCHVDHSLNRGIVEDVAYARRVQQLITGAIDETS